MSPTISLVSISSARSAGRSLASLTAATTLSLAMAGMAGSATASDARSIALGGSIIAGGEGAPGALANPAALMDMKRRGQRMHVGLGLQFNARDDVGVMDLVDDNESLADDIDDEIDAIDLSEVTCIDAASTRDTPCLDGLGPLGSLAGRALDVLDEVDGETVAGQASGTFGLAFSGQNVPFALYVQARATGRGRGDVSQNDRDYLTAFTDPLADGQLTLGEIENSVQFAIDESNRLDVARPEDQLDSRGQSGFVVRGTFGFSLATSFTVAGFGVDLGVTPKFSTLIAQGIIADIGDEFDDAADPFEDRLEASEVEESSFTFDVGAATVLNVLPLRIAAVLRNVVTESIETREGIEFETTPQLVVGAVLTPPGPFTVNADIALNEADVDGLSTQPLALGAEFSVGPLDLRGGISHDGARREAATALSVGLGIGPFDIGARATALEDTEIGAQLSFSY